jgi:S1-C subfamily serine protease
VPGDEIISIDGQSVATLGAAMAGTLLSSSRVRINQSIRLELARDGDRLDVAIKAVNPTAPAPPK